MTQNFEINGNYTLLKQDDEGLMVITLLHNTHGLIDTYTDGMTNSDATSWFDYTIKQHENKLHDDYIATLDNEMQTTLYEMQDEVTTLAHFNGYSLCSNTFMQADEMRKEYLINVNVHGLEVTHFRGTKQDAYSYCLTHNLKGMIARYFNKNNQGLEL